MPANVPVISTSTRKEVIKGPMSTPLTRVFGIKHPIVCAGMNLAAGPRLAAAVSNAGGLACIGGNGVPKCPEYETMSYEGFIEFLSYQTPEKVRLQIQQMKANMVDKSSPFGVDLLLPKVGGSGRKTNYDYSKGQFDKIIDGIIEEGAKFFVCALGAPPKRTIDKLHSAGIIVANIIGHPRQVQKSLDDGCDMLIAQGWESGGHTGHVASSILTPTVVRLCKGRVSPLTGEPVLVLSAGGVHDGRSLAAALMWGADGVWVGTRFVASEESGASNGHQEAILKASLDDTIRSTVFTGRPMRVINAPIIEEWHSKRRDEMVALQAKGLMPMSQMLLDMERDKVPIDEQLDKTMRPLLVGQVAGLIDEIKPAGQIVDEMVRNAVKALKKASQILSRL